MSSPRDDPLLIWLVRHLVTDHRDHPVARDINSFGGPKSFQYLMGVHDAIHECVGAGNIYDSHDGYREARERHAAWLTAQMT